MFQMGLSFKWAYIAPWNLGARFVCYAHSKPINTRNHIYEYFQNYEGLKENLKGMWFSNLISPTTFYGGMKLQIFGKNILISINYYTLPPVNSFCLEKGTLARVFQLGFTSGGTFWAKWPKTAWKLQNQHFWGKAMGYVGNRTTFWVVEDPPVPVYNQISVCSYFLIKAALKEKQFVYISWLLSEYLWGQTSFYLFDKLSFLSFH